VTRSAPTLVVLAAGLATRYDGLKQLQPVGPSGEALMDYGVFDALRAGFARILLVVRRELEPAFRHHVEHRFGGEVPVAYAFQELKGVPPGFRVPPNRVKPWGTGHAVLAAAPQVDGPFAVSNADDFYGAASYRTLAERLTAPSPGGAPFLYLVGYRLDETLSAAGGVSRAVCQPGADGLLRSLVEVRAIRHTRDGIAGITAEGSPLTLTGQEMVSMNLWGGTPTIFPALRSQFAGFLLSRGGDPDAEFLLSTAVNREMAEGHLRLAVLPATDRWFGMTFTDDKEHVMARLRALVNQGAYPDDLAAWFRRNRR
jgi:hypothetical protein